MTQPELDVKAMIASDERVFKYGNHSTTYLFFPAQKDTPDRRLMVSFGAYGGSYNRIRGYYEALHENWDLLYLLDRGGYEKQGCYYLAADGDYGIEAMYQALIRDIVAQTGLTNDKVYFLGSSMGGFAAMYYGAIMDIGKVVAICPLMAIGALYSTKSPKLLASIVGPAPIDVDEKILSVFKRRLPAQFHIIYGIDDDKLIVARLGDIIKSFVEHRTMYTVESYDIDRPDNVSAHNATVYIVNYPEVAKKFAMDLHFRQPETA